MPRLSFAQRNQALGLLAGGATQTEVARRFNVAESTITRLVIRVNATGTTAGRPRPGQPRVTSVPKKIIYGNVTYTTDLRRLCLLQMQWLVIVDGLYIVTQ